MPISQLVQTNADLLIVGIAVAGIALLGSTIFFNDPRSATNRAFFAFALWNVLWSISNYFEYKFSTPGAILWALRTHLFLSTWYALLFFWLAYVFPREKAPVPAWFRYALMPVVVAVSALTLTPYVFSGVGPLAPAGEVTRAVAAPGIAAFILVAFGLLAAGLVILFRRMRRAEGLERRQTRIFFSGMALTALLILIFNVVLPNDFQNVSFIPLAALFLLPFIALTFYAIYRHHLFSLRIIATVVLGFMVTAFSFANIVFSNSAGEVALNVTAFVIILLGSVKIVRDTLSLQRLAENLSEVNTKQEGLIHFIGHEVKGYLTKDEGAFAALVDGDFGTLPEGLKPFVARALAQTRDGVTSVTDILKAANQKKGTIEYRKEQFDLKELASEIVEKERANAEHKGLRLSFVAEGTAFQMTGDRTEIGDHVMRNLIQNAVNYTPSGAITVVLRREGAKLVFSVKDTGVGITDEDKKHLFTEGGHGKESQTINVHSTGYGLYIAKNVVEAHGGTIRAESEGPGKGSVFIVEFPVE